MTLKEYSAAFDALNPSTTAGKDFQVLFTDDEQRRFEKMEKRNK